MSQRLPRELLINICEAAGVDPNKTLRIILTPMEATFVVAAPLSSELSNDVKVPICHHAHPEVIPPKGDAWD